MFVLMSSRSSSKLGHLVSKTRSPGQISRKLCYNHFELWSECLPWSVLDQALKVLCCSGERYRAIMALLFHCRFYQRLRDPLLNFIRVLQTPSLHIILNDDIVSRDKSEHFCPCSPVYHRIKTLPIVNKLYNSRYHAMRNIQILTWSFSVGAPNPPPLHPFFFCVFPKYPNFLFLFIFCPCESHSFVGFFFFSCSYFSVPSFCMLNFGLSIPTLIRL